MNGGTCVERLINIVSEQMVIHMYTSLLFACEQSVDSDFLGVISIDKCMLNLFGQALGAAQPAQVKRASTFIGMCPAHFKPRRAQACPTSAPGLLWQSGAPWCRPALAKCGAVGALGCRPASTKCGASRAPGCAIYNPLWTSAQIVLRSRLWPRITGFFKYDSTFFKQNSAEISSCLLGLVVGIKS